MFCGIVQNTIANLSCKVNYVKSNKWWNRLIYCQNYQGQTSRFVWILTSNWVGRPEKMCGSSIKWSLPSVPLLFMSDPWSCSKQLSLSQSESLRSYHSLYSLFDSLSSDDDAVALIPALLILLNNNCQFILRTLSLLVRAIRELFLVTVIITSGFLTLLSDIIISMWRHKEIEAWHLNVAPRE